MTLLPQIFDANRYLLRRRQTWKMSGETGQKLPVSFGQQLNGGAPLSAALHTLELMRFSILEPRAGSDIQHEAL